MNNFNQAAKVRNSHDKKIIKGSISGVCKVKQSKIDDFNNKKIISKSDFNKATVKLIINTVSPFSFVEHDAFIEFCQTIANQAPTSRKTLMKNIEISYNEMKIKLIQTLKNVEWVCVTADLWTSFKRYVCNFILL